MNYLNNKYVLASGIAVVASGLVLVNISREREPEQQAVEQVDANVSLAQETEEQQKSSVAEKNEADSVEERLALMEELEVEERGQFFAEYVWENGFDAGAELLGAFEGQQEQYWARKALMVNAGLKEPKKVLDYLRANDPYMLTDEDVITTLMGSQADDFRFAEKKAFAASLPQGYSKKKSMDYLAQNLLDEHDLGGVQAFLENNELDAGSQAMLYRSLPARIIEQQEFPASVHAIEALQIPNRYVDPDIFLHYGQMLAEGEAEPFSHLEEIESLNPLYRGALLESYLTTALSSNGDSEFIIGYAVDYFMLAQDNGELLNKVMEHSFSYDPVQSMILLEDSELDDALKEALVHRHFRRISGVDPGLAKDIIADQNSDYAKDALTSQYIDEHVKSDPEGSLALIDAINEPSIRENTRLRSVLELADAEPELVHDYIGELKGGKMKDFLAKEGSLIMVPKDAAHALLLANSIEDQHMRKTALKDLLAYGTSHPELLEQMDDFFSELTRSEPDLLN